MEKTEDIVVTDTNLEEAKVDKEILSTCIATDTAIVPISESIPEVIEETETILSPTSKVKGVCDIVFLVDATGSMQPAINDLKNNIKMFFNALSNADSNGESLVKDWRARVIGYRDVRHDGKNWWIDNKFVRDPEQIEKQLDAIVADGGGDEPESLLDALYMITKFGSTPKCAQEENDSMWRYRSDAARIVIVFSDASFHGQTYLPDASGLDWRDIANLVMQEKIRLSIYAPHMNCYDDLSQIDKCEYMPIEFDPSVQNDAVYKLRDFTADTNNFQKTLQQLAKTVSVSAVAETL